MKITFSLVALCAVLVLGVASLPISTGGSAQADDSNFSTSAHVASATVARGGTAAITAIVTNRTSATSASVDVEIYDANGAKWFERAYDGEWFNARPNHQPPDLVDRASKGPPRAVLDPGGGLLGGLVYPTHVERHRGF